MGTKYGMDAKIEHKYFDLVREEYVDGKKRTIRRCKICQRDYKGTASVNSNFITHLKHVHPELLHDWARKKAERAEKATSFLSRHQGTTMLPTSYGRNYLSSIASQIPKVEFLGNSIKEGLTAPSLASLSALGQSEADRQVAIMRSVLNFLVMDIQPASVINRKGFRNLIKAMHPFFGLPTANQIRDTLIPSAYEHVKDSIVSQLSLVPVVNIQISLISNCFLAVTVYYLSVYWELKHHLLAVHIISPNSDWRKLVEQTKQLYGISNKIFYEKINRISREDFTKNTRTPGSPGEQENEPSSSEGEEDACDTSFAYVITKVIHQALSCPSLTVLLEERCAGVVALPPQTATESRLYTPYWIQTLQKLRGLIQRSNSFKPPISSTPTCTSTPVKGDLGSCTTLGFTSSLTSTLTNTLSSSAALAAGGMCLSNSLSSLTASLGNSLLSTSLSTSLSNPTLGGGLNASLPPTTSLSSLSTPTSVLSSALPTPPGSASPVKAENKEGLKDLAVAFELVDILEPFEEVYNMISSEAVPSVGIIVPSILSLNHICQEMKPLHLTDVVSTLMTGLQRHLMPLVRQKYHQEAAALDPRFKMKWCRAQQEEAKLQDQLDGLAQELRINNPSPATYFKADENVDAKANGSYEQASKRRKLFSFLEKPDEKEGKRSSALLVEFADFVREQLLLEYECPLRYWLEKSGTYRCLAQLAYYLCSIPACPPPIDKVFLEWTVSANSVQQCNSPQELERLFFLNLNSSLW